MVTKRGEYILDEEEGLRREESTYLMRRKGYKERRVHT